MSTIESQQFWDERARDNALYAVDNRIEYTDPADQRFWSGGDDVLDTIDGLIGLPLAPDQTVVDIGCGLGRMTRALSARVARVVGIDISSEMLVQARELNAHLDNVEWLHGDGQSLAPIPDASAEGCFSHVVFQHLPDPQTTHAYVREIGRVLRPGGWAAFQVSTDPAIHAPKASLKQRLKTVVGRGGDWSAHPSWRGSAVTMDALRETADGAGMDVVAVSGEGTQFTMVRLARRA